MHIKIIAVGIGINKFICNILSSTKTSEYPRTRRLTSDKQDVSTIEGKNFGSRLSSFGEEGRDENSHIVIWFLRDNQEQYEPVMCEEIAHYHNPTQLFCFIKHKLPGKHFQILSHIKCVNTVHIKCVNTVQSSKTIAANPIAVKIKLQIYQSKLRAMITPNKKLKHHCLSFTLNIFYQQHIR